MANHYKILGSIFLLISLWTGPLAAFLTDDSYESFDERLYHLQGSSRNLLIEIRHTLKERDPSSKEGKSYLLSNLPLFKDQIKKLQLEQKDLVLAVKKEKQSSSFKRLSKKINREQKFLDKIASIISRIDLVLIDANGGKKKINISGEIQAGIGFSGRKTNTTSSSNFLYKANTNAKASLSENLKANFHLGHNREYAVTPYSTTDLAADFVWKKDRLSLSPTIAHSAYEDLNNSTLGHKTFRVGMEEKYQFAKGNWSLTTSQNFRNHSYNTSSSSFTTFSLKNAIEKKTRKGNLKFNLDFQNRSNKVSTNQSYTRLSPGIKWNKKIDALTKREVAAKVDFNNYKNSPTNDSFRFHTHMLYDTRTKGAGQLSYGPTFDWSRFSNGNSSYFEPGYQRTERRYDYEKGSISTNDRYYYHHSSSSETNFLKWDLQKILTGPTFKKKYRFIHTKQNNFKLSLAFSSPHDGEQSWLYQWRPKLNIQEKNYSMNIGLILGHNMFLDISHYKTADDLKKSGASSEDPFKKFIKNTSNSLQYGVGFDLTRPFKGIFTKIRQSSMRFATEYSQQLSYFAQPKSTATTLSIGANFSTPLTKKIDLNLDLDFSRTNTSTTNTSGDPLKRYHALLSLKAPIEFSL